MTKKDKRLLELFVKSGLITTSFGLCSWLVVGGADVLSAWCSGLLCGSG